MKGGREGGRERGRHDFHVTARLPRGSGNPRERLSVSPSVRPSASASVRLSNHQRSPRDLNTPDAICLKTKRGKINGREYLKLSEFRAISSSSSSSSSPSYEKHGKFPRTADDGRRIHWEGQEARRSVPSVQVKKCNERMCQRHTCFWGG